jgi:hypothetical protein
LILINPFLRNEVACDKATDHLVAWKDVIDDQSQNVLSKSERKLHSL